MATAIRKYYTRVLYRPYSINSLTLPCREEGTGVEAFIPPELCTINDTRYLREQVKGYARRLTRLHADVLCLYTYLS